jgi:hypothetical protein
VETDGQLWTIIQEIAFISIAWQTSTDDYGRFATPFHGGNTGSNPVGDANSNNGLGFGGPRITLTTPEYTGVEID